MANTSLFAMVLRAMRLARIARLGQMSAEETMQRWQATALQRNRRAFLRSAAIAAAGSAAGCIPFLRQAETNAAPKVAVVGAGIAGLTAAYRLHQAGVNVQVYEAQNRIGGRMLSIRDHFAGGQVAELGAELIDTGHTRMRALAAELSLELDDFEAYAPDLSRSVYFFDGHARSERAVVEAFIPIAAAIDRDLANVGDGDIRYDDHQNAQSLDRESMDQWFDRHGVSGWIRSLLAVAYTTEMGLETSEQSALNLLTFISREPDPFKIFGESDERFHTRGGNDLIISGLGQRLNGRIETGSVLESLTQNADGSFSLSVRRDSDSRQVQASHVILAIPITTLRHVELKVELPEVKRQAIAQLQYGTNAKLMIGFAQRSWAQAGSDGSSFSDLSYQTSWEASRQQPGVQGILTNFVGGRHGFDIAHGTAAEQAALAVADLEKLYPGISNQRTDMKEARFHWPSHPWAQGSYMCLRPGDWTRFGGVMAEPLGRLRFCGEHCSVDNAGFMEGGCETGEDTAAELLQEMGLSKLSVRNRRSLLGLA